MKKKITAIALVVALLAIALIGGTMAYFTDNKAVTNTFTAGKVEITLDEAKVVMNDAGNLVADGTNRTTETDKEQTYKLFPGMTVTKDPTITLVKGSEEAYLAAKITVTGGDLNSLYPLGDSSWKGVDVNKFLQGGLIGEDGKTETWNGLYGWNGASCFTYQDATNASNNTWVFYVFIKDAKTAPAANSEDADTTVKLFEKVIIDSQFDNAKMEILNGVQVKVEAFATQTNGFTDCYDAMTKAFPTQFPFAKGEE